MYQDLKVQDLSDEELEMVVGGGHHKHSHSHQGSGGKTVITVVVLGNNDTVTLGVANNSNDQTTATVG